MALALAAQGIVPVMLVFCSTSLKSPVARLRKSGHLFEGKETFEFVHAVTGFDLFGLIQKHRRRFAEPVRDALAKL